MGKFSPVVWAECWEEACWLCPTARLCQPLSRWGLGVPCTTPRKSRLNATAHSPAAASSPPATTANPGPGAAPRSSPILPKNWFPAGKGERPRAAVPGEGCGGKSILPAASRLLNFSLAAKDTHVCIKLLSSQSNSGTSDSNYRYITGADKSGARQPGTCRRRAADTPRGAQRGCVLSHPLPALFWGSLCAARSPGTPPLHRGSSHRHQLQPSPGAVWKGDSVTHGLLQPQNVLRRLLLHLPGLTLEFHWHWVKNGHLLPAPSIIGEGCPRSMH